MSASTNPRRRVGLIIGIVVGVVVIVAAALIIGSISLWTGGFVVGQ